MTLPVTLEPRTRPPLRARPLPMLAVGVARLLAILPPRRLRAVLELARRRARPATATQALAARQAVVAVSLRCAGRGCLQRSIAAALYCRALGTWPTWCAGVRTAPFAAHAWVEVDGRPVGEPYPAGHYRTLLTVAPEQVQEGDVL
jgi:hypothetical protein